MAGIQKYYEDALGKRHAAPDSTIRAIRAAIDRGQSRGGRSREPQTIVVTQGTRLEVGPAAIRLEDGSTLTVDRRLPSDVPLGYHEIERRGSVASRLIVAPAACHLPRGFRTWGWVIQLYAARSRRSWGMGDLADLRWLGRWAGSQGAGIALINPLSAATPLIPQQPSPYFPSSRRFRSPLYLRIEEVTGAREVGGLARYASIGRALNGDRRIRRDGIFRVKLAALERIWKSVRGRADRACETYCRDQRGLDEFATFSALAERFGTGWQRWPVEFRHPSSPAVGQARRERETADRVQFHKWVQYQIDRQLARASAAMPVMQDLPIGFDMDGADAWEFQDVLAHGISVGAPPDEFNTRGQDWGLPPFVPDRLRAAGYEPFVQTIRACLRHAGGLRIDHAMGLFRLFWIPVSAEPKDGAYVRGYPADLLSIVALESQRAKAVIVGEDLGTVEDETREQLAAKHILSYRLLWFEKTPPSHFPERALAAVTTHDLPTIAGLWSGSDLKAQQHLGLSPNAAGTAAIRSRIKRLTRSTDATPAAEVIVRLHEALSHAPSRILTATLDDAMVVEERPNMPATTDEWPNWCLSLPKPIEALKGSRLADQIAKGLSR
jgi:4-alpha-glucanotransferase